MGEQFVTQLVGVVAVGLWSGVLTWILSSCRCRGRHARCWRGGPRDSIPCCTTRKATTSRGMERRGFIKFCAVRSPRSAPRSSAPTRAPSSTRGRGWWTRGAPLRAASAIPVERNFIFHYPFAATPCFLLNLGKPVKPAQLKTVAGEPYEWRRRRRRALGGRLFGDLRAQALLSDEGHQLHQLSHREERAQPHRQRDPLLLGAQPVRPGGGRARGRRPGAAALAAILWHDGIRTKSLPSAPSAARCSRSSSKDSAQAADGARLAALLRRELRRPGTRQLLQAASEVLAWLESKDPSRRSSGR